MAHRKCSRPRHARVIVAVVIVAAAVSGCAGSAPAPAWIETPSASDEQKRLEVLEAHRELVRAYESRNTALFVSLLAPSADLEIFHPLLKNRFADMNQIQRGLSRMFRRLGDARWTTIAPKVVVRGDVAWLTAQMTADSPLLPVPFIGRGTEIWLRMEGRWRLVHAHWSPNPEMVFDRLE